MKMKVAVCWLIGIVAVGLSGCGYKIGGPPAEVTYRSKAPTPTTAPSPGEHHDDHKH